MSCDNELANDWARCSGSNRWKTNNHVIDKWRATAVNISRVTVNCFLFDVIVFAMLPAHCIWWETVSLLDVMWQWTSQWMGGCSGKNASYIYNKLCHGWNWFTFHVKAMKFHNMVWGTQHGFNIRCQLYLSMPLAFWASKDLLVPEF